MKNYRPRFQKNSHPAQYWTIAFCEYEVPHSGKFESPLWYVYKKYSQRWNNGCIDNTSREEIEEQTTRFIHKKRAILGQSCGVNRNHHRFEKRAKFNKQRYRRYRLRFKEKDLDLG